MSVVTEGMLKAILRAYMARMASEMQSHANGEIDIPSRDQVEIILAAVAPMIAKAERERVKKLVANECEDLMQRTKTPIQRAREDGHLSEECHQEGRWHGINDLLEYVEKIRALGDAT